MIVYSSIFDIMKAKGIRQTDLRDRGIHPRTFQKLANGDLIRSDTINELCRLLDCQPGDFMQYVPDPESTPETKD